MIVLAGSSFVLTLSDGRKLEVTPTTGDELRFERLTKTSLVRLTAQGEGTPPAWVIIGIVHTRLRRDGVADIPEDQDDFADLIVDLDVVTEGKAEVSDPTQPTG